MSAVGCVASPSAVAPAPSAANASLGGKYPRLAIKPRAAGAPSTAGVVFGETIKPNVAIGVLVVVGAGVFTLWRAREPLGVQQHPELRRLLARVWPAALFLLPNLQHSPADAEAMEAHEIEIMQKLGFKNPY